MFSAIVRMLVKASAPYRHRQQECSEVYPAASHCCHFLHVLPVPPRYSLSQTSCFCPDSDFCTERYLAHPELQLVEWIQSGNGMCANAVTELTLFHGSPWALMWSKLCQQPYWANMLLSEYCETGTQSWPLHQLWGGSPSNQLCIVALHTMFYAWTVWGFRSITRAIMSTCLWGCTTRCGVHSYQHPPLPDWYIALGL